MATLSDKSLLQQARYWVMCTNGLRGVALCTAITWPSILCSNSSILVTTATINACNDIVHFQGVWQAHGRTWYHGINDTTTYMQNSRKLRSRNHKVFLSSYACIEIHSISSHTAQNSLGVFVRPSFVFCRRRDCRPLLTSALRSCSKGSETGK